LYKSLIILDCLKRYLELSKKLKIIIFVLFMCFKNLNNLLDIFKWKQVKNLFLDPKSPWLRGCLCLYIFYFSKRRTMSHLPLNMKKKGQVYRPSLASSRTPIFLFEHEPNLFGLFLCFFLILKIIDWYSLY